jgi:hypothetical protein
MMNDDGAQIFNPDTMRAAEIVPFGVACYTVTEGPEMFHGMHTGVVRTCEEAERWVGGDDTVQLTKVFGR